MFKKTILSIVAIATLSASAFGADKNVWEILEANPEFVKTAAVPEDGGKCVYSNTWMTNHDGSYKTEAQLMRYMKGFTQEYECSDRMLNGGVEVSCGNSTYYFFFNMDICERQLKKLKGGN